MEFTALLEREMMTSMSRIDASQIMNFGEHFIATRGEHVAVNWLNKFNQLRRLP